MITLFFIIFGLIALGLSCMAFVDYYNGKFKAAAFSGVLALLQIVIIGIEVLK